MPSCWYPAHQPDGLPADGSKSRTDAAGKESDLEGLVRQAAEAAGAWEKLSRATPLRLEALMLARQKERDHVSHRLWDDGIHDLYSSRSFLGGDINSFQADGMVEDARKACQAATDMIKASETSGTWQALAETAKTNAARAEQEWTSTLPIGFRESDKESAFELWKRKGSPAIWRLVESVALSKLAFAQVQAEAERAKSRHEAAVAAERAAADWAAEAAANVARVLSKPPQ